MPKYSSDFIRRVSDANDIVDIVSQYVPLKQKGRTFTACCPFHSEKTPSFHVDREKQLYHCFGCGAGGDIYKFLMEKENIDFTAAVKILAERAGISLPTSFDDKKTREEEARRQKMYEINATAANFYYKNLVTNANALNYLQKRGIGAEEVKKFGLGLAPDNWSTIIEYLTSKGYTIEEVIASGLALKNRDGTSQYDRFRNRIVYPIQNVLNRVIGFGARKINDNDQGPKYLNTPETEIFKKGTELFNLNRAKSHLRSQPLILVEGYMDVIALNKYGIENVAAALGTAFTPNHAQLISRYSKRIILCYDGDTAGEKATLKTLDILDNRKELDVRIIRLPSEHDPDTFIRENGTEAFQEEIENSLSSMDFKISLLERDYDLKSNTGVLSFVRECVALLKKLDPIERDFYTTLISKKSGISVEAIQSQLVDSNPPTQIPIVEKPLKKTKIPRELVEAQIVYLLFIYEDPKRIEESEISQEMLTSSFFRWFYHTINAQGISEPDLNQLMSPEEHERFDSAVARILIEERENVDTANGQLFEKSIETIKKYNRQIQIHKLSSEERLGQTGDDQKSGLFNSIIEIKKVDF